MPFRAATSHSQANRSSAAGRSSVAMTASSIDAPISAAASAARTARTASRSGPRKKTSTSSGRIPRRRQARPMSRTASWVVDHLVFEAEVGRREETQPDGIEPGRGGRLDLLDGRRAADGQVIERQSAGDRCIAPSAGVKGAVIGCTGPVTSAGLVGRPVAAASWTAIVAARVARPSRPSIRGGASPRTTAQK